MDQWQTLIEARREVLGFVGLEALGLAYPAAPLATSTFVAYPVLIGWKRRTWPTANSKLRRAFGKKLSFNCLQISSAYF